MRRETRRPRGSMLVVSLWLLAALVVLAVSLAGLLSTETRLMRYRLARLQARTWARAGVYLAMQRLGRDVQTGEEAFDWLGDEWALPAQDLHVSGGVLAIRIVDEERKLDLNAVSEQTLADFLGHPAAARAIAAYRHDAHRPLVGLEEVWELPDLPDDEELRQRLAASATVWTSGRWNINTVTRDVLAAFTPDGGLVDRLVESRPGPDGRLGTADDCLAATAGTAAADLASCAGVDPHVLVSLLTQQPFEVRSSVFRILVRSAVEALGVQYRVEAVVRRGAGTGGAVAVAARQPFQILAWREGSTRS
ncbi:MAG: general secretion pathway protein GspK [Candidatus Omnitrophica bacterium]|nr:general secretion pathway protein GspK [Candidatus Omnitrophota bacterium]